MRKKRMQLSLSTKVFIGFAVGIAIGIFFKEQALLVKPIGDLFLNLIKMIVVPLVFFSIVSGISNMGDIQKLKRVGSKTLFFYLVTTLLSGAIGLAVANLLMPGQGFEMSLISTDPVATKEMASVSETLLSMIPVNPIQAFAEGNLMQIIVFSSFLGIGMTLLGKQSEPFKKVIDSGTEIMLKVTGIVMAFSPYGVAALIAASIGEYGLEIFGPLAKFILADYIGLICVVLFLYIFLLKLFHAVEYASFLLQIMFFFHLK